MYCWQSGFIDLTVLYIIFVSSLTTARTPFTPRKQFQGAQCQRQISASCARVTETYTRTTPIVTNLQIRALDNDSQIMLGLLPELLAPLVSDPNIQLGLVGFFFQRNLLLISLPILPVTRRILATACSPLSPSFCSISFDLLLCVLPYNAHGWRQRFQPAYPSTFPRIA
ncbi:hypothetical protein EDB84DRAFT_380475 [Lactarius hengduanensis]|nr:hypothetical protein EDB84DRAFT_380475 [Lactarius hengduanensis]